MSTMRAVKVAVSSYNEWDPLEEVVLGVVDGACVPGFEPAVDAVVGDSPLRSAGAPSRFPVELIAAADRELEAFEQLLQSAGVAVRRPDPVDHGHPYATPGWQSPAGLYGAMPRDIALVVGDTIIEAPTAWRCRYFEHRAYRPLFLDFFRRGARLLAPPKPMLEDELYAVEDASPFATTEAEIVFDAADFVRCGRDIFGQRSHVTNELGIEWLRRQLEPDFRVHELSFVDPHPMHIDGTFMPLAPGKLLVNPDRVQEVPAMFAEWDVIQAPRPPSARGANLFLCSAWVSMNVLMLDPEHVVVEAGDVELQRELRLHGFEVVACEFANFNRLGGGFHCATLDVRRRGELESYW